MSLESLVEDSGPNPPALETSGGRARGTVQLLVEATGPNGFVERPNPNGLSGSTERQDERRAGNALTGMHMSLREAWTRIRSRVLAPAWGLCLVMERSIGKTRRNEIQLAPVVGCAAGGPRLQTGSAQ
jgi:hypothetical protein